MPKANNNVVLGAVNDSSDLVRGLIADRHKLGLSDTEIKSKARMSSKDLKDFESLSSIPEIDTVLRYASAIGESISVAAPLAKESRVKRLVEDLQWAQKEYAKAILKKEGYAYDQTDPDIKGAQDICSDSDDPIGDIQNVINDITDGNSSYDITESIPDKQSPRPDPIDETEGSNVKLLFPGDEGDIAAEDYVKDNHLEDADYSIEWDDVEKGYALTYISKQQGSASEPLERFLT